MTHSRTHLNVLVKHLALLILGWVMLSFTNVTIAAPSSLSYQGRILKLDGTPLSYNNVSFIFQIKGGPNDQCLIYQEQVNGVDLSGSGGVFDVPIGAGTVYYPTAGSFTVLDSFNNSGSLVCGSCVTSGSSVNCSPSGSSFTPAGDETRTLVVQFFDGSGWQKITPSTTIRSVPFAGYAHSAQKLGTNLPSDFILKSSINNSGSGSVSCGGGSFLTWDAATMKFGCASVTGSSGGTVQSVTASAGSGPYLTVSADTVNPVISLNVGTTAGKLAAADDSRLVHAVQDSSTAGGDVSGTFANLTVAKINGVPLQFSSPADGQYLKYISGKWVNSALAISDVSGLSTQLSSKLDLAQMPSTCGAGQTLTYVSPSNMWTCLNISINESNITGTISAAKISGSISGNAAGFTGNLTGDVTGTQGATKVVALQNTAISSAAPANNQILMFNGSAWAPASLPGGYLSLSGGTMTGAIDMGNQDLSSVGNVLQVNDKVLKLSNNAANPTLSGASDKGKMWFDSVANQIKYYDGAAIRTVANNSQFPTCSANQYLTYDGTSFTCANDAGASGAVANLTSGTSALTFSSSTGSITATIATAGNGVTGLLSGTDWTTFNSKLDKTLASGSLWIGNASNVPTAVTMSGDATLSTAGTLTIANSAITDSKVSSSAAIARNKLASGPANRLVVNNSSGVMVDAAAITANMAMVSDANGIPTHSAVTSTQLGYLSSVTSDVQTQLNGKVDLTSAQIISGLKTFQPSATANQGLVVKGAASQTAKLQEWQDSTGAVLSSVDATGKFNLSSLQISTGAGVGKVLTSDASGNASWGANNATDIAGLSTTGIVQRNGSGSYSTVTVNAPLTYSSGTLGVSMAIDDLTDAISDAGNMNVGLGSTALSAVTSGYATTAVGGGALSAMTSGNENTAVGMNAMHALTSGWQSTAVGAAAFDSGTASRTTAIGAYSLRVASGTGSTSLGYGALQGVTSGSYNTGLGYSAGGAVSTGSNNIFVGSAAGSNLTTGSGNIVIGNNINAPAAASTNTLNIGNLIYGTSLDGSAGTLSTGSIGIGKTNPGYKLDVVGDINVSGTFRINGAAIPSGTVSSVTSANSDISVASTTTTPVLTLNSGAAGGSTDANKIAKLDANGLLAAAMIPNISTSKITGVLPIANGGTNSSTALVNNRMMASSNGAIVEAAAITANRALVSDANGIPTHSAVTSTQLGYLSSVTSDVQTQINGKASSSGWTNYSVIGVNGSGALNAVPGTVNGSILQYSATGPTWSSASFPSTTTANQILYSSSNNVVGGLATVNSAVLTTDSSGVPAWSTIGSDTFTQYALLVGRSGGQVLKGGTAASENLTLDSTANVTKGSVLLQPSGGNVGIGTLTPAGPLDVQGGTNSSGAGLPIKLIGQNGNASANSAGGAITLTAGNGAAISGGQKGGAVSISGGVGYNSGTGTGVASAGGSISLLAGAGSSNSNGGNGGSIFMNGGGANGTANNSGGGVGMSGGQGVNGGSGGTLSFSGGTGGASNGSGGDILITSGSGGGTNSNGGNVKINGGANQGTGTYGNVNLAANGGNVGIGTNTPAGKLTVQDSGATGIQIKTSGAAAVDTMNLINDMDASGEFWFAKGTTANASPAAADKLVNITNEGIVEIYGQAVSSGSSGVLALKTESGGSRKEVSMEFYADPTNLDSRTGFVGFESNTAFDLTLQNDKSGNMIFATFGTERMRINSGGSVGIGTTNPGYKLDVQGGDINASGSVRAAGVALTSDVRFKRDIQTLDHSLEKVLRVRGVSYNWRRDEFPERKFSARHQIGVIAQEIEKEFPEAVDTNPDGYKAVNYPALVSPLIESTKELYGLCKVSEGQFKKLDRQMASLDGRVQKLESENAALRKDNESLRKDLELIKQKLGMK